MATVVTLLATVVAADIIKPADRTFWDVPEHGRKGITTINCICACDFDMKFTFACVGWEGLAHDMKIFLSCLNNESYNFPKTPPSL